MRSLRRRSALKFQHMCSVVFESGGKIPALNQDEGGRGGVSRASPTPGGGRGFDREVSLANPLQRSKLFGRRGNPDLLKLLRSSLLQPKMQERALEAAQDLLQRGEEVEGGVGQARGALEKLPPTME